MSQPVMKSKDKPFDPNSPLLRAEIIYDPMPEGAFPYVIFITDDSIGWPHGTVAKVAQTKWGARRKARKVLRDIIYHKPEPPKRGKAVIDTIYPEDLIK